MTSLVDIIFFNFFNIDCIEFMRKKTDKFYDLAIVDPPYGLGKRTTDGGTKRNSQTKFMKDIRRTNWDDNKPNKEYWNELFRVSKNQIVWGGNYFGLPAHRTFIVWDKMTYIPTMSQIELAWTSFDSPARLYKINSNNLNRIHPTEKPVLLYRKTLLEFANKGDKILDTHGGSFSIAVACELEGFDLDICEIDTEYFNNGLKRFKNETAQTKLFC